MCRWFISKSNKNMKLKNIILNPKNSILKQSINTTFTPNIQKSFRNHELNVDGFGIAWYGTSSEPFLYRNPNPPWMDNNLLSIGDYITSKLYFAHVRAAAKNNFNENTVVHEYNCHPFKYKNYLWMHNGIVKSDLLVQYTYRTCHKTLLDNIKGNSDSEYAFCIFLNYLLYSGSGKSTKNISKRNQRTKTKTAPATNKTCNEILKAFRKTIKKLKELVSKSSSLNFAVTDGKTTICSRIITNPKEEPPSLYYVQGKNNNQTMIASEPIHCNCKNWKLVPKNKIVILTKNNKIKIVSY